MNEKLEEFFLVALPGLEDLVLAEVAEWYPRLKASSEHGGVTVHAPLAEGLGMNLALKTPTRACVSYNLTTTGKRLCLWARHSTASTPPRTGSSI